LVRPALATFGLGLALALAGCGGVGEVAAKGDLTNGKTQFKAAHKVHGVSYSCAGCHTLADAGAAGTIGPNLDTTFGYIRVAANKGDRFCQDTVANVVLDQIRFPSKNNLEPKYVMPANIVTGKDAVDVAQYVASVVGLKPGTKAPNQPAACTS
jgi:mono/diheme cytochrome c family protein